MIGPRVTATSVAPEVFLFVLFLSARLFQPPRRRCRRLYEVGVARVGIRTVIDTEKGKFTGHAGFPVI
jgi:hypothetical protein